MGTGQQQPGSESLEEREESMAGPVLPKSSIDLGNLLGFPPP